MFRASGPSYYREMLAILMALTSFDHLANKTVRIYTENIAAAAYVNHLGGSSLELCQVANAIWIEAISKNIALQARSLSTRCGQRKSRLFVPSTKQVRVEAAPKSVPVHRQTLGVSYNRQVGHVSEHSATCVQQKVCRTANVRDRCLDSKRLARRQQLLQSPFRLTPQLLQVIEHKHIWAIIIAPYWKAQPWCQKLTQMSICPPLKLPKRGAFIPSGVKSEP